MLDEVLAPIPPLRAGWQSLWAAVGGQVDAALLGWCAVVVADTLGVSPLDVPGVGEAQRRHATAAADPAALTPLEDAVRAFAVRFVADVHAVTDADVAALAAHLDPPALVALTEAVALLDAATRVRCALGVR